MPQKNRTVKGVLGGLLGLVGLSAVAGLLVTTSVTPVLAMTGLAGNQALTLFEELPDSLQVNAPMEQSTIYAKHPSEEGQWIKLASFYEQNRIPVTFEQVSPNLLNAILSSEDKNFYSHGGVNLGATVKALVDNLRGTSNRGASTITQQFVKNVQIQQCEQDVDTADPEYSEKLNQCWTDATQSVGTEGFERKLKEMRLSIQIEKEYSKNDILMGYLNIANFGGTVYGIEAASNYYFSTSAAELTVAQAATLAGIVQNPNTLRIDKPEGTYTDKDGVAYNTAESGYADTLNRRNYVLARMKDDGKITKEQYDQAMASPIEPILQQTPQGCGTAGLSAYFCQYVKSIIENDPAFGANDQERSELLRRGGLQIYTTLDLRIQDPAASTMASVVPANADGQYFGAAGVSLEVGTGRILSMTQNTNFTETPTTDPANTSIVFAGNKEFGNSGGFQVGSTYKLFTLIDWLEKGHSLRESLNGRTQTNLKMTICDGTAPVNTREIGNYGGGGGTTGTPMSFTASSLNSGYFAMAAKLDICDINKVAERMGVKLANGGSVTSENVAYDVLGPKSISPLDMAAAHATVASGGKYCAPRAIDRVVGADGEERAVPAPDCREGVISPEVAATAAYALAGVMNGGTGRDANPYDGTPVIGKTGTHDRTSTMMIESSTKVTTAVWAGRWETQTPIDRNYSAYGRALNQVRYPLAKEAQRAANQFYGGDAFPQPDSKLNRQILTDVPNVTGMTVDDASAALAAAGFSVSLGAAVDSDQATNIVVGHEPSGQAPGGATITISPSNGQGATVPGDLIGMTRSQALSSLAAAGFTSRTIDSSCNPPGVKVNSTDPAPGTGTTKSTTVTITCE